ncbi:hypothetical protein NP233_g81 [Leucocoprinus birnbaumii]|uniref:Uncharacterized protein n=1 Tax=Leucocoprinus birnbaumii TaxID=56174 RepID=A0AAD5YWZ9_9AGAR|nr:hypothetical protein NP233_g81 [Leucocoprinus birnbaumii]
MFTFNTTALSRVRYLLQPREWLGSRQMRFSSYWSCCLPSLSLPESIVENSALKVAVREYLELLVTACNLKVQADEATKLVTQLSKSKAPQDEIKVHRIRYQILYAQWDNAMEPVELAHQKAVDLKKEFLDGEISIPSFEFLEGKKRSNDRAHRLVELQAQLVAASADTNSGDTGLHSAGNNAFPNPAPVVSAPSAQVVSPVIPTAQAASHTTSSATKEIDAMQSTSPETGAPGIAAPSLESATARPPAAATVATPPWIYRTHGFPNPTTAVDEPLVPSVYAPAIELLQAGTPASYAPIPVAPVDHSSTTNIGTSPASFQSPNATLSVYTTQPHTAHPPSHPQNPNEVAPVAPLNVNDPSHLPAVDRSSGSIPSAGTSGGSVGFLNSTDTSGVRDPSSGALVNTNPNFHGWDKSAREVHFPISTVSATFGDYIFPTDQGLVDPSSGGANRQMTRLLGDDYVFNDVSLPGNQNHPGLSFDTVYKTLDPIATTDLPSDNPSDQPKPSVPIKRSLEVDSDSRPGKKTAKKRNDQPTAKTSKKSKATAQKDPFIMFTPGEASSRSPNATTTTITSDDNDNDKKRAKGKKDDDDDADDNEERLAEASKALAKARLELLPQEVPPFKLYVEPANPLDFSSIKHRTIDLPITYLLPKNLPARSNGLGRMGRIPQEWYTNVRALQEPHHEWRSTSSPPTTATSYAPIIAGSPKKIENDVQFETHKPGHYFVTGVPGITRVKRVVKTVKQAVSKIADVVKTFPTGNEPRPPTPPKEDPAKAEDDKPLEREPGKLHCGCIEDEVLLDLILWKSTLQQSPTTGIIETWQDTFLHPRDRTFSLRAYTFWTGLKANHLYEFDAAGKHRSMIDITRYQYRFFRNRLRQLKRAKMDVSEIIPDFEDLEMISFDNADEDDLEEDDDSEEEDDGDDDNDDNNNDDEDDNDEDDDGKENESEVDGDEQGQE